MDKAVTKPLRYIFTTGLMITGLFILAADEVSAQTNTSYAKIQLRAPATKATDYQIQSLRERTALGKSIRENAQFEAKLSRMEFAKSIRTLEDEKRMAAIDQLKRKLAGYDKKGRVEKNQKIPVLAKQGKTAPKARKAPKVKKDVSTGPVRIPANVQRQIAKKVESVTFGLDRIMDKRPVQNLMRTCDLAAMLVVSQGTLIKTDEAERMAGSLKATVHLESSSGTTKVRSARENPFQVERGTLVDYVGNYGQIFATYAREAKAKNSEAVPVSYSDIAKIEKWSMQIQSYKGRNGRNIPVNGTLSNELTTLRRNDFAMASMTAIHFKKAREEVLEPCTNIALKEAVDEGFDYLTHWRGINGARNAINNPKRKDEALRISGVHKKVIEAIVVAEATANRFGKTEGQAGPKIAKKAPPKADHSYATSYKVGDMSGASYASGTHRPVSNPVKPSAEGKVYASLGAATSPRLCFKTTERPPHWSVRFRNG